MPTTPEPTPGEFALIERLRATLPSAPDGEVWSGDDTAVLSGGLLLATDALVETVHFRLDWTDPASVGWKALAVNVSDVAAMGGEPTAAVAAITLPVDRRGLGDAVAEGIAEAASALGCPLVGGDVTSGPCLMLAVAILGRVPPEGPVLRSGATPGDVVYVSGTVGGPAAATEAHRSGAAPDQSGATQLHRPMPRLDVGRAAAAAGATAMIDVSDGLAADIGHICDESGVGVELVSAAIPLGPGARLDHALGGGDDYELAFCLPSDVAPDAVGDATAIGRVTRGPQRLLDGEPLSAGGWTHDVG